MSEVEHEANAEGHRLIFTPFIDGKPVYDEELADLAEVERLRRLGQLGESGRLTRSEWLQAAYDSRRPGDLDHHIVFNALQGRMLELMKQSIRDTQIERRTALVAYDVLRHRQARGISLEATRQMWLWVRSDEAYVGKRFEYGPGERVPEVTGAASYCRFATGWELGYEDKAAERWFVTFPAAYGVQRLDFPLDAITAAEEGPAVGFVETLDGQMGIGRSIIR